jgi:CSLREA domain-containing protein
MFRRIGVLGGAVALLTAGSATASTIMVTTTDDVVTAGEGRCSLRQAISAVNAGATTGACAPVGSGSPMIVLGPGTYPLTIAPTGKPGHNTVRFRLTLKPGSYKLTATATAGGKHSETAAKRFRIKS